MSIRLPVKCPLFFSYSNETWVFSTNFRKILSIKFNENPSSGIRVFLCGQTDGQIDMTKLIVAFRDFSNSHRLKVSNFCYSRNHLSYVPFQTWTTSKYGVGENRPRFCCGNSFDGNSLQHYVWRMLTCFSWIPFYGIIGYRIVVFKY